MNPQVKKHSKIYLSWLLTLVMVLSLISTSFAEVGTIDFQNLDPYGSKIISLTEKKDFEASILTAEAVDPENVIWSLSRCQGAMDKKLFPYQYLGGELSSWKQWGKEDPLFSNIKTEATMEDGQAGLKLSFSTELFFDVNYANSPRNN